MLVTVQRVQHHLKVNNPRIVSVTGLNGLLLCVNGYGWSLHQTVRIINGTFMLALFNTIELILECVIVYHISSSIILVEGEKLSI